MIRGVRCGKGSARGELGGSNAGLCTCPGQPLTGSGIFNFELLQGGGLCLYKEKIGSGQKRASTGVGMGQKGGRSLSYNASPFSSHWCSVSVKEDG